MGEVCGVQLKMRLIASKELPLQINQGVNCDGPLPLCPLLLPTVHLKVKCASEKNTNIQNIKFKNTKKLNIAIVYKTIIGEIVSESKTTSG